VNRHQISIDVGSKPRGYLDLLDELLVTIGDHTHLVGTGLHIRREGTVAVGKTLECGLPEAVLHGHCGVRYGAIEST
jgi:hypothetical protein